jgi:hypothetical protein
VWPSVVDYVSSKSDDSLRPRGLELGGGRVDRDGRDGAGVLIMAMGVWQT